MKADGLSERGLRLHGAKSEQRPQPPCATSALPLGRVRDPPGWGPGLGRSEEASSLAGGEAEILGENQVTPRPLRGLLLPEASRPRGKGRVQDAIVGFEQDSEVSANELRADRANSIEAMLFSVRQLSAEES